MSGGDGGQVVLSQTTRDLVQYNLPDGVHLRDLGELRLKDLQRPSRLFQLAIVDLPADFPPLKALDTHPNNLPIQLTSLIGREKEGATIGRLLAREDARILTVTGPGAPGHTRLSLHVAAEARARFPEVVNFVSPVPIPAP